MALTPEQTAAIIAELSVDLATVTDDRLIELCLLYRSAPEALPTFPNALNAEITRRFTAAEIAANDVMFSVIQNFSNNFNPELQYKEKMYEFVNAPDRELWVAQNITFFEQAINISERATWIVNNSSVVNAIALSPTAMAAVAASSIALAVIVASGAAMAVIVASNVAMTAVAASSIALSAVAKSATARTVLMNNNVVFQENRVAMYNTIKASWTKQAGVSQYESGGYSMTTINSAMANPNGFVFASLGWFGSSTTGLSSATHPNNVVAATKNTSSNPTTLANLDAVSFNGATFKSVGSASVGGQAYAELWIPPA